MAKHKKKTNGTVLVAEAIGRAFGMVPGTANALKMQHPHPVDEAMAALAEGQATLADATAASGDQAAAPGIVVKTTARRRRTAAKPKAALRTSGKGAKKPGRAGTGRSRSGRH